MERSWIALSIGALALAGCGSSHGYDTYGTSYGYGDIYSDVYTDVEPPTPMVEVLPPQPGPGYAWINGYWAWTGNRYVWQRGHWDRRPAGRDWVRHGWVYDRGRYRYVPGRWAPRGRYRDVPYVHGGYPQYRRGDRYAVIPHGQRRYPYAHVPREYVHPRYRARVYRLP